MRTFTALLTAALIVAGCTAPNGEPAKGPLPTVGPSVVPSLAPGVRPENLGNDPNLDRLANACFAGVLRSCDQLVQASPPKSQYEQYGATCGGRNLAAGSCVNWYRAAFSLNQSPRLIPAQGSSSGNLVGARANGHDGYDRFVLEFSTGGVPRCEVYYLPASTATMLGATEVLHGVALLAVVVTPGGYAGPLPQRIASDTVNMTQAALSSVDSGQLTWVLALNRRTGFEVSTQDNRIIVDISQR